MILNVVDGWTEIIVRNPSLLWSRTIIQQSTSQIGKDTHTHTPPAVPGAMDCADKGGCGVVRGVGLVVVVLGPEDISLWRLKALVRLVRPVQNKAMQDNNQFSPIYYLSLI